MAAAKSMSEFSPSNDELHEAARAYGRDSGEDLEFPIMPEFDSRPPRLNPTDYMLWCEEMLKMSPPPPGNAEWRAKSRCEVEFVL